MCIRDRVVETSVTVNNNSPIQDYVHPDDQTQPIILFLFETGTEVSVCNSCKPDLSNLFSRKEREFEIFKAKLFECTFFSQRG